MKKRLSIIIISLLLIICIFLIKGNIDKENIKSSFITEEKKEYIYVFYEKDLKLYGVPMIKNSNNKYDLIEEVFDYLTINKNHSKKGYYSHFSNTSRLVYYKINNKSLTLGVSSEFLYYQEGMESFILQALYETYLLLGYNKIIVEISNYNKDTLGNVILDGVYDNLVNNVFLDFSSTKMIKVYKYLSDDIISFDNYFVRDPDTVLFVLNNILNYYSNTIKILDTKIVNNNITVEISNDFTDFGLFKKSVILSLQDYNFTFKIA